MLSMILCCTRDATSQPMITADKLEKYEGGPTPPPQKRLHITICSTGAIRFNRNFHARMGKPPAVYLYYDRVAGVIAIEPVHSFRMPSAFPVMEHSGGFRINAAPFCKHYGIRVDATERFTHPEPSNDNRRWLFKLSDTVTVRNLRGRRKKKE